MTITDIACDPCIDMQAVSALLVDDATQLRVRNRLNGDPHLGMLWQLW